MSVFFKISQSHSTVQNIKISLQQKCIKIYLLSFTKLHFFGFEKIPLSKTLRCLHLLTQFPPETRPCCEPQGRMPCVHRSDFYPHFLGANLICCVRRLLSEPLS